MAARPGLRASCACGKVELETSGAPIGVSVCYCDDCQAVGREIEAMANGPPVLDPDAGSSFVVYRRDRLSCVRGEELLRAVKLKPESPTVRYVASCCNSAMYVGFDDGKHWVDVFRARVDGEAPPIEVRMCTRFAPEGTEIPKDAPSSPGFPFGFIAKIMAARLAMLFGS